MLRPEPVIRPELKPVVLVDNDAPNWGVVLVQSEFLVVIVSLSSAIM